MKHPKVSVIVPNYNHAKFLRQRIDSILTQTYQDFELILLDDCSTDNSLEILNNYQSDKHVSHVLFNDRNSGNPFSQWIKGIELSSGDFVWIAESDDVADEDFLMTLVPLMEKNSDAVLAFSHSYLIDEKDALIDGDYHIHSNPDEVKVLDGNTFARKVMTTCNYIYNASMVLFKRSAYSNVRTTFQQYQTCGDWAFWMEMCLQGKVIEVGKRLSYFRQHHSKVTVHANQTGNDWLDVARLLTTFISLLKMDGLDLRAFRGQWTKYFRESNCINKKQIIADYPLVFAGSEFDVFIFQLRKIRKKIQF